MAVSASASMRACVSGRVSVWVRRDGARARTACAVCEQSLRAMTSCLAHGAPAESVGRRAG